LFAAAMFFAPLAGMIPASVLCAIFIAKFIFL
jgi:hypothetical protein